MNKRSQSSKRSKSPNNRGGQANPVEKFVAAIGYFLKILMKTFGVATRSLWQDLTVGGSRFRKWINSRDGIAVICFSGILALFCLLWIVDALRQIEPLEETIVEASSQETQLVEVSDVVLARIGQIPIMHSQVLEFARQTGKLSDGEELSVEEVYERGLVQDAVDKTVLAYEAGFEAEITGDTEVLSQLTIARNRILAAAYLRKVIEEEATIEKARELYDSQRENLTMGDDLKLSHIVVGSQELAVELAKALDEGAKFEQIARDISIDVETAQRGGALGYISYAQMPTAYTEIAYRLSDGEISTPFAVGEKWIILRVEGRRGVKPPSFTSVEEDIMEFLRLQAIEQKLKNLREEREVEILTADTVQKVVTKSEEKLR